MSSTPYMPLFIGDYMRKTRRLKAAEHGAYLLILMALWDEGGTLPNDQDELKAIARVSRNWSAIWGKIERYFTISEGSISHAKVTELLEEASIKRQSYVERGRRGGRKSSKKRKENKDPKVAELKQGSSNQTKGLGSPLTGENPNRSMNENQEASENLDHAAEPVAPARESGGGSGSCSGEEKQLPLRFRLGEDNYQLWLDLRENLRRGGFSTFEIDQIKPVLLACDEGTFTISTEPLEGKRWEAVQEIALAEGLSFTLKARPQLKAISGGRA